MEKFLRQIEIKLKKKKRQILGGMVAVAIAGVAIMNMDFGSKKQDELSALHLANIEALAQGESGGGEKTCYNTITTRDGVKTLYCGSCTYVNNSEPTTFSGKSTCK